jgi:hypothetical protein
MVVVTYRWCTLSYLKMSTVVKLGNCCSPARFYSPVPAISSLPATGPECTTFHGPVVAVVRCHF